MLLQIFPAWVPTGELLIALVAFIVLVLVMNRGDMWILNVLAQDEPLAAAAGVLVFVLGWTGWLASNVGGSDTVWMVVGALVALGSVFIYRSDRLDISGLI